MSGFIADSTHPIVVGLFELLCFRRMSFYRCQSRWPKFPTAILSP